MSHEAAPFFSNTTHLEQRRLPPDPASLPRGTYVSQHAAETGSRPDHLVLSPASSEDKDRKVSVDPSFSAIDPAFLGMDSSGPDGVRRNVSAFVTDSSGRYFAVVRDTRGQESQDYLVKMVVGKDGTWSSADSVSIVPNPKFKEKVFSLPGKRGEGPSMGVIAREGDNSVLEIVNFSDAPLNVEASWKVPRAPGAVHATKLRSTAPDGRFRGSVSLPSHTATPAKAETPGPTMPTFEAAPQRSTVTPEQALSSDEAFREALQERGPAYQAAEAWLQRRASQAFAGAWERLVAPHLTPQEQAGIARAKEQLGQVDIAGQQLHTMLGELDALRSRDGSEYAGDEVSQTFAAGVKDQSEAILRYAIPVLANRDNTPEGRVDTMTALRQVREGLGLTSAFVEDKDVVVATQDWQAILDRFASVGDSGYDVALLAQMRSELAGINTDEGGWDGLRAALMTEPDYSREQIVREMRTLSVGLMSEENLTQYEGVLRRALDMDTKESLAAQLTRLLQAGEAFTAQSTAGLFEPLRAIIDATDRFRRVRALTQAIDAAAAKSAR